MTSDPDVPLIGWAVAYGAAVAVAAVVVAWRREATLCSGRSLLLFNAWFAAAALGATLASRQGAPGEVLVAGAALILPAWAVRARWLVVRAGASGVAATLEGCLRRLCTTFERAPDGYAVALPGGALDISVRRVGEHVTVLAFRARPWHRKVDLIQSLLAKQYRSVMPTIRVRIR